jgi:hypothetical protein
VVGWSWNARSDVHGIGGRITVVRALLAERLGEIAWAKETEVAFDFGSDSRTLDLELDLPSLDEMPHRSATMPARGVNLKITKRSDAERRRDFVRLAAGSVMRVAGEALAALPSVEEVAVSAFTQRPCPTTGGTLDVYLLSVRIRRHDCAVINFRALGQIEPEAALARFDLRMKPERNGGLREVEPHQGNVALFHGLPASRDDAANQR